jgi:Arc/MetJ-type ribon-helix-helix transcriptional regulator
MKSSISAKIPTELYEEVQAAIKEEKYTSNTECIIKGLNLLLRNPLQESIEEKSLLQEKETEIHTLQEKVKHSKEEIHALQEEVKRSKEEVNRSKEEVNRSKEEYTRQIKDLEESLRKAPDLEEFSRLQARSEELEKHNQTLKGEIEKQLGEKEKELEFLKGQITIKDQQIEKQAFSLQSVIQENSRLNLKLLPESQDTKSIKEEIKLTRWQYLKGFVFGSQ